MTNIVVQIVTKGVLLELYIVRKTNINKKQFFSIFKNHLKKTIIFPELFSSIFTAVMSSQKDDNVRRTTTTTTTITAAATTTTILVKMCHV